MRLFDQSNKEDGTRKVEGSHLAFGRKQEKQKSHRPSKHHHKIIKKIIKKQKGTLINP